MHSPIYKQKNINFSKRKAKQRLDELLDSIDDEILQSPESAHKHIVEALNLAQELGEKQKIAKLHKQSMTYFRQKGDYKQAAHHLKLARNVYSEIEDIEGIIGVRNDLATLEFFKGNLSKALKLGKKSLKASQSINYKHGILVSYNVIGLILQKKGNIDEGLTYFFRGLKLAEKKQAIDIIASLSNNIGICYQIQKKPQKALPFLFKALNAQKKMGFQIREATSLGNIGLSYNYMEQYEEGLKYAYEALKIYEKNIPYSEKTAGAYNNISLFLEKQGKFEEALLANERSLKIRERIGIVENTSFNFIRYAAIYFQMQQYDKVLFYTKKAEKLVLQIKNNISLKEVCELFIETYNALGKHSESIPYYEKILKINEEIFNEKSQKALAQFQVEYETAQKEKEIELQKLALEKKEIQLEQKKAVEQMNLQLEIMVEERTQQLQIQNEQLKQYAYIVAHDLKEPLCNLSGLANLLHENYYDTLDDFGKSSLKHIAINSDYMNKLLEDLLIYATLNKKSSEFLPCVVPIKAIQKVICSLSSDIEATKAEIKIAKLPPKISILPKHFILILQNLLKNALKFGQKEIPLVICIAYKEKKRSHYFEVIDNGIGISSNDQQKIFNVFYRLDKNNYEGTGIGLAICTKIVQLYNGEIGVKSTVNQGSSFYFSFPK